VRHHLVRGKREYEVIHQEAIGRKTTCTVTSAEIHAIKTALVYAQRTNMAAYIMSDSQEALKRIRNGGQCKGSREVVAATLRQLQLVREKGIPIKLLWVPGHRGITGNERAHRAA
jgi:ribonuclease HI